MLKFEPGSEGAEIVRDRILEGLGRSIERAFFGLPLPSGREKSWTEIGEEFEANLRQSDARDAIGYAAAVGRMQRPTMITCDDVEGDLPIKRGAAARQVQRVGRIEDGPAPRLVHPTNTSEEKPVRLPQETSWLGPGGAVQQEREVAYPFAFWRDNRLDATDRNRPGSRRSFAYPCRYTTNRTYAYPCDWATNRTCTYPAASWATNRCKVIHDGLWKELVSCLPKYPRFTFRELFSCDWVFEEQSWNPTRDKASR